MLCQLKAQSNKNVFSCSFVAIAIYLSVLLCYTNTMHTDHVNFIRKLTQTVSAIKHIFVIKWCPILPPPYFIDS